MGEMDENDLYARYEANELYELKDDLRNAGSAQEFIERAWENSSKNAVATGYIAGVIDALYYAGKLTQAEYTRYYRIVGL